MTILSCEQCRELAPDVALGIADGDDRAAVLAHASSCAACRIEVEALSASADQLLLVGPQDEPPAGFETAVLRQLETGAAPARRPRHRTLWLVAAATVAVVVIGLAIGLARRGGGTDVAAGASYVGVLDGEDGTGVGEVAAFYGSPSKLVIQFDEPPGTGDYRVRCEYADRGPYVTEAVVPDDADPSRWTVPVDVSLHDLQRVVVVGADDHELLHATMRRA